MTGPAAVVEPDLVSSTALVTIGDLEAAARTLAPVAVRTPLLPADVVSELVGAPVWIKPEMLQRGGT
jgi:threonine dehydratase